MKRHLAVAVVFGLCSIMGCNSTPKAPDNSAAQSAQPQPAQATTPPEATDAGTVPAPGQQAQTAPTEPPVAAEPEPPPPPVVIPAGTTLTVKTGQPLGSKTSTTGDSFSGMVTKSISVGGKVAVPASSSVMGSVVAAKAKGKVKGEGELDLTLTTITIEGTRYQISTNVSAQTIKGKGKRTAVATGGGAAGGALIGGLAGGGKGAAIGAGVGAGAGLIGGTVTGNKQIELPAESVLSFQLKQSVTLK